MACLALEPLPLLHGALRSACARHTTTRGPEATAAAVAMQAATDPPALPRLHRHPRARPPPLARVRRPAARTRKVRSRPTASLPSCASQSRRTTPSSSALPPGASPRRRTRRPAQGQRWRRRRLPLAAAQLAARPRCGFGSSSERAGDGDALGVPPRRGGCASRAVLAWRGEKERWETKILRRAVTHLLPARLRARAAALGRQAAARQVPAQALAPVPVPDRVQVRGPVPVRAVLRAPRTRIARAACRITRLAAHPSSRSDTGLTRAVIPEFHLHFGRARKRRPLQHRSHLM